MNGWELVIAGLIYAFFMWMYYCLDKRDRKDDRDDNTTA